MHPEIVGDEPGTCPTCGMKLDPDGRRRSTDVCPMHPEVTHRARDVPDMWDEAHPARRALRDSRRGRAAGHGHTHAHDTADGLEWEDLMPEINRASDMQNMIWKLVDRDTGKENGEIDWTFRSATR